jgi:hypothetical protein
MLDLINEKPEAVASGETQRQVPYSSLPCPSKIVLQVQVSGSDRARTPRILTGTDL